MLRRAIVNCGWPVLYWLAFVALAAHEAHNPGYFFLRKHQPYPWAGLAIVTADLGFLTAWLWLAWRPAANCPRSVHAIIAGPYALLLLVLVLLSPGSDMPGLAYVPGDFARLTLLLLAVRGVTLAGCAAYRRAIGSQR